MKKINKLKIYLETSVISQYYDKRPMWMYDATRKFWKSLQKFEVFTSEIVIAELSNAPNAKKIKQFNNLIKNFKLLRPSKESEQLKELYLQQKIIPASVKPDAEHIAIASAYNLDCTVSWNLKHIAKLITQTKINQINLANECGRIELRTPLSV